MSYEKDLSVYQSPIAKSNFLAAAATTPWVLCTESHAVIATKKNCSESALDASPATPKLTHKDTK